MPMSLPERRALLREAANRNDTADFAGFAQALDGANEEDRAALAKTLPPTRLFTAEGPTPRACFVLAALGKPKLVAETIGTPAVEKLEAKASDKIAPLRAALSAGAAGRDQPWAEAYVEAASGEWFGHNIVWPVVRELVAKYELCPESLEYLSRLLGMLPGSENDPAAIVTALHAEPRLLAHEWWTLFRVEGAGAIYYLVETERDAGRAWQKAILSLCDSEPGFRDRMLDESLGALLRDFSAKNIVWYHHVHRAIDPTSHEVAARQSSYFAVLGTAPSTAVGLSQDMLARAVQARAIDVDRLIEASPVVLMRTEKKLVKAQLALLAALKADAPQRQRISRIVAEAIDGMPLDLAAIARKLIVTEAAPTAASTPTDDQPSVIVAGPRRSPLPERSAGADAAIDDNELFTLVAEQFEGRGNGADLPRVLHYLAAHPHTELPEAMQQRALELIESVWDEYGASPRRHLAAAFIGRGKNASGVEFRGYARYVVASRGKPEPAGVEFENSRWTSSTYDPDIGEMKVTETGSFRSGYQYLPTQSPAALLAGVIRRLRLCRNQGKPFVAPSMLDAYRFAWKRVLAEPGEGTFTRDLEVLGEGPRPFWITTAPTPDTAACANALDAALDVSAVAAEYTFRAQEARDQDGYDQIVQWAGWLLQGNPDTLAAHFHPTLCAATVVVNVRGIGPLMAALGASRQVPGAPTYSALALAASAKMAEHRVQAAEAIAQLADAGLLDPESFAAEAGAHLADGYVMAGRIAETFADAASISPLAGYRILQTLAALLPHLIGADGKPITQAGKVVELTARLAADYGTPVEIPQALAARQKGSSSLAVAVGVLKSITPRATPLAQEAAAAAQLHHDGETT